MHSAADVLRPAREGRRVWLGEAVRWYLTRARHPFKSYVVGHYWRWFARPLLWVRYEDQAIIGVRIGDYVQQRIFFDGHYERELIDWLKANLTPHDVFWDIGANIGAVSIVAAKLCGRVLAFEPDPRSVEALTANLRANGLDNVETVVVALGAESGRAVLNQSAELNTGMTSLLPGRGEIHGQVEVAMMRADDLVRARPQCAPTVMKLDVEGAEHLVLAGAEELLRRGTVRAIVFEDRRDNGGAPTNVDLVSRLRAASYRIEPLGASVAHGTDGMFNFLATRSV